MIPLADARDRVLRDCVRLPEQEVELREALGLVTTRPVVAAEPVPPFANTGMDGFAVVAADTVGAGDEQPVALEVVGTAAAGSSGEVPVGPGQAVRIMTGAPIPPGADAVVMVERCRPLDDGARVEVTTAVDPGNHIRAAGEDLAPGDEVIPAGTALGPGHLGVLASLGHIRVAVTKRARVGVMSTGDELVEGPAELAPGQIRDSNRHTLLGLLTDLGCEAVDLGIVADDAAAIRAAVEQASADCDALVTSGGVSMGDFDYVKAVLDELGDMEWMQVAIKPAKPLAFGTVAGTPVFGLPGNPVSSMVSFELFARPGLRQMMGHPDWGRMVIGAVAPEGLSRRPDGKTHFVRVRLETDQLHGVVATSAGGQGSHQLTAMADADGLAVVDDGDGVAPLGVVPVIVLRGLPGALPG
ncbi:MAG: gephyrin-like molybdotransferase Glp [Acidimicrobiales bacterium]